MAAKRLARQFPPAQVPTGAQLRGGFNGGDLIRGGAHRVDISMIVAGQIHS